MITFDNGFIRLINGTLVINTNVGTLDSEYTDIRIQTKNGGASIEVMANRLDCEFLCYDTDVSDEEAKKYMPSEIKTRKTWFGLGKTQKYIPAGWRQKNSKTPVSYITTNYLIKTENGRLQLM